MSSEQENNENEANVDLKGVIKDLAEQIKKLTDIVEKSTKKINANTTANADWHKYQALMRIEQEKEHGRQVRMNKEYGRSAASLQMFTGLLTKGASAGFIFNKLANTIGGVSTELDKLKSETAELTKLEAKYKKMGIDLSKPENIAEHDIMAAQKARVGTAQENLDEKKGGSGKLAEGISSMKEFANKHKTGILIGAGSIGILLTVLKKAFDVSPMFQAIKKLLQFGFMLILRPIGDFFGFIMRPIMVLMLRKFIIPWYKDVYPYMKKWGQSLGNAAAAGISLVTNPQAQLAAALIVVGITAATFFGAVKLFKMYKTLNAVIKNLAVVPPKVPVKPPVVKPPVVKPPVKPPVVKSPFPARLLPPIKPPVKPPIIKLPAKITNGLIKIAALPAVIKAGVNNAIIKSVDKIKIAAAPIIKAVTSPKLAAAAADVVKFAPKILKFSTRAIPIVGTALLAVDAVGTAMKKFLPDQYEGIRQGGFAIGKMLGDTEGTYSEGVMDFFGFGKESTGEQIYNAATYGLDKLGIQGGASGIGGQAGVNRGSAGDKTKSYNSLQISEEQLNQQQSMTGLKAMAKMGLSEEELSSFMGINAANRQVVINIDHVSNEADIQRMGNVVQERIQESNKRTVKSY